MLAGMLVDEGVCMPLYVHVSVCVCVCVCEYG